MNDKVVISGIPFYTQRLDAKNYAAEGFPTVSEAEHWSERVCGLACVKMVIAGFTGKTIPLYELLQEGNSFLFDNWEWLYFFFKSFT